MSEVMVSGVRILLGRVDAFAEEATYLIDHAPYYAAEVARAIMRELDERYPQTPDEFAWLGVERSCD